MKKTLLCKTYGIFIPYYTTSFESGVIANYLTDSYDDEFTRQWLNDNTSNSFILNSSRLEKSKTTISFQYLCNVDDDPFTFVVSKKEFVSILDQWIAAIGTKQKYIVIDVNEHNKVSIYPTSDNKLINFIKVNNLS